MVLALHVKGAEEGVVAIVAAALFFASLDRNPTDRNPTTDPPCCAQVEQLEDPVTPAVQVIGRCEARQLMTLYKVALSAACCSLLVNCSFCTCHLGPAVA